MKKIILILFIILVTVGFIRFTYAEQLNEQIIKEKMIWGLPELLNYTFRGSWEIPDQLHNFECLDLRYININDNDQHSEFYLCIFDSTEKAKSYFNERKNGLTLIWLSGKYVVTGWDGNDAGTIVDNNLFNFLKQKYLEKYPNDSEPISNEPSCCSECVNVHSAISGRPTSESCINLRDVDLALPYHLSNNCVNYFQANHKTILECINVVTNNTKQSVNVYQEIHNISNENKSNLSECKVDADCLQPECIDCSAKCINGKCVIVNHPNNNIWQKILVWFRHLFNGK